MAVGVIVGASFGRIVSSLVNDVIMPPIGLLMGNLDFGDLYLNLSTESFSSLAAAEQVGAPIVKYGLFVNNVLDFTIVAFAIFVVVRMVNTMKRKQEHAPPPGPSAEAKLLTEIRDVLTEGRGSARPTAT